MHKDWAYNAVRRVTVVISPLHLPTSNFSKISKGKDKNISTGTGFSGASIRRGVCRPVCRDLCHNPPMPASLAWIRPVSLAYMRKAAKVPQTSMHTAIFVSLVLTGCRAATIR